jgi:hypothetical protein
MKDYQVTLGFTDIRDGLPDVNRGTYPALVRLTTTGGEFIIVEESDFIDGKFFINGVSPGNHETIRKEVLAWAEWPKRMHEVAPGAWKPSKRRIGDETMSTARNKVMLELEKEQPEKFNKSNRKKRMATTYFKGTTHKGKQIYHMCPKCKEEIFPIATHTGDGWAFYLTCEEFCTEQNVDMWPFGDVDWVTDKELEAVGFEVE